MNYAKIAAALHALADAFLEGAEETPAKGKGKGKAAAAAAEPTPATPAVATPEPVVPTVTKDQLNKAVLKVAAKDRGMAEAVLAKFGLTTTVNLAPEKWQVVYDAFEEEIAKIDAAAVQVSQVSLV